MGTVFASLVLALRQLADPAVLRVLAKSLVVSLILFVAIAAGSWHLIDTLLARGGLDAELGAGAEGIRGALAALGAVFGLWLIWRIVAIAVIQFFADEVVAAVEARHYAESAALARTVPLSEQVRTALGSVVRTLIGNIIALPLALVLVVSGVGPALVFFLVNAALLGRDLQDMVWLRHARSAGEHAPVGPLERFAMGGAITAMLAFPGINLVAPLLGAAGATHLVHRKIASARVS